MNSSTRHASARHLVHGFLGLVAPPLLATLLVPSLAGALTIGGEQKLVPPTALHGDEVGWAVGLDGGVAAVGAPEDSTLGTSSGAVHVYALASGAQLPVATLTASDGVSWDELGTSVAISGDTIVAGAFHRFPQDASPAEQGRVYVFHWDGVAWTEQAKLEAPDGVPNDAFGWSVALQGDTLAVGAPKAWVGSPLGSGAVYLFERSGGAWSFAQKLSRANDHTFGWSISLDGDTLAVGSNLAPNQHVAIYLRDQFGGWAFDTLLDPSDDAADSEFGNAVALRGDDLLVGAWFDTANGTAGSAYFFRRTPAGWTQMQKVKSVGGPLAESFGESVALDGDVAVITDSAADADGTRPDVGAAYVFKRVTGGWSLAATLVPSDPDADSTYFGASSAIQNGRILIGAWQAYDATLDGFPGAAYAYAVARGSRLLIQNANPDNEFRNRIAFSGRGLAADVPLPGSPDDPTRAGGGMASLTVSSATSGHSFTQLLPCANWKQTAAGYRYRDPELDDGPCGKVDFNPGGTTRALCSGAGPSVLGYDVEPGQAETPVVVRLTLGATSYCTVFGGTVKKDGSDGARFLAINAGAPEVCPGP